MSPTPRGKHVGTIRRLRRQLESRLPSGTAAYEVPEPPALVVATDSFPRYGTGAVG